MSPYEWAEDLNTACVLSSSLAIETQALKFIGLWGSDRVE